LQEVPALKRQQFDCENEPGDLTPYQFDQFRGGVRRAARGKQIVDYDGRLPFFESIDMDIKLILSVFKRLFHRHPPRGKLARLSYRNKRQLQRMGYGRTKEKSARFNAYYSLTAHRLNNLA
jgi:hypothetical protein